MFRKECLEIFPHYTTTEILYLYALLKSGYRTCVVQDRQWCAKTWKALEDGDKTALNKLVRSPSTTLRQKNTLHSIIQWLKRCIDFLRKLLFQLPQHKEHLLQLHPFSYEKPKVDNQGATAIISLEHLVAAPPSERLYQDIYYTCKLYDSDISISYYLFWKKVDKQAWQTVDTTLYGAPYNRWQCIRDGLKEEQKAHEECQEKQEKLEQFLKKYHTSTQQIQQ